MILCCGEALIDMIPASTKAGPNGFVPHVGGSVFNTAIALGRFGTASGMLTGLSTDMFGQQLLTSLEASDVDTSFVIRSARPTTLAFVTLSDGQASYAFFDENSAGRMILPKAMPSLPHDVSTLFFGGISLACEPCADAYAALLEQHHQDRLVMIDPNIRRHFIPDEKRYRARLQTMISCADIVKVSDEDLDWIDPASRSLDLKARALLEQGPTLVILTRGSEGATGFLANGEDVTVPGEVVAIVDTVGAGDTFNAGVLTTFSQHDLLTKPAIRSLSGEDVRRALRFGSHVAAITVSRAGANPPWRSEIDRLAS